MKIVTAIASAALLPEAIAFAPSPNHRRHQQRRHARTTLSLVPVDPTLANSVIDASLMGSSSIVTSNEVIDSLGSVALIAAMGLGLAGGKTGGKQEWNYKYTPTNDLTGLGLLEETPATVVEKAAKTEPEDEPVAEPEPEPEPVKAAVETPPPPPAPKVKPTSPKVLESVEIAKAEVQKVGVAETKEKMSSKTQAAAVNVAPTPEEQPKKEVAEAKKPGAKRRFAKGMGLIAAAVGVAVARNVIKAYLGRGVL